MNRLRWVVALLVMVMFSMVVFAAEVVEAAVDPVWYGNVKLWEILATLVAVVWAVVKVKYKLDERMGKQVNAFLEMGVQKTYDEFVRVAKEKNSKGKLTAKQVKEARDKAFDFAKDMAMAKGVDLAKQVVADQVPMLITGIVNRIKSRK